MITQLDRIIINNIENMRAKHMQTQAELAASIGVSRSFISAVCSYRKAYNLRHINKIAIHFHCSLHDIIPSNPINSGENYE